MKTAFVTGATGFIGYHLCKKLHNMGYKIIAIGHINENYPKNHIIYRCNLDSIPWEEIPKIDVCFHQAANNNTLDKDEKKMIESNVDQSRILFENLIKKKCKKIIYASSCSVYGNQPTPYIEDKTETECLNVYAKSKLLLEKFAKDFSKQNKIVSIGLRYSNVYGPNEEHKGPRASMVYQITNKIKNKEKIKLFKYGEQKRDWVYVEDVVNANILSSKLKKTDIFNVGSGESVDFNSIVENVSHVLKTKTQIEYIDCNFTENYQSHTQVDLKKSNKFGYSPKYSIKKGIKKLINSL